MRPELKLVGVAAAAPATYLGELFRADRGSHRRQQPDGDGAAVVVEDLQHSDRQRRRSRGHAHASRRWRETCIERITELLQLEEIEAPLQREFLKVDPTTIEPWRGIMDKNTPGKRRPVRRCFIVQGTADELVRPQITKQFADHLCEAGAVVEMKWLEGVSHAFAGYDGADSAVAWMADRFRGHPAPNGCGTAR